MRITRAGALLATVSLTACDARPAVSPAGRSSLDSAQATAMRDSVRLFMASVAQGVTAHGPSAWRTYFADEPAFFMADEGRLAFPDYAAANRAIASLTQTIAHIDLRWGDTVRVDPLAPGVAVVATPYHETQVDRRGRRAEEDGFFTGIAEHGVSGWQFRDAHWSLVGPASPNRGQPSPAR